MLGQTKVLVKLVDVRAGAHFRQHKPGDCGLDIEAWNPDMMAVGYEIAPHAFCDMSAGINVKVADGTWGMIRPRSSAFAHHKIFVMGGTLDSGYTGPLYTFVFNPGDAPIFIPNGTRLAQLILVPMFDNVNIQVVERMPETVRGETGFGSTSGGK